ncbi:hypothetical protein EC991_000923 [Linnemannia zychae]|nr:hypothetical protein EC991_000923 [Linnemannia zychae]
MGILAFNCVATDVAQTTFYGISNAERYGFTGTGGFYRSMVLAKSNANPTNVMTTNWSFLSSYSAENLSVSGGIPVVAGCAVDSRGVVTYVAAHYSYDATQPYSKYFTALRYDPAGTSDPTLSQGIGSWTVVTLNPAFGQMTARKISLHYNTIGGVETLNIAIMDDSIVTSDDSIVFGTYDAATATFNPTGRWAMPPLTYGNMDAFLLRGNELYYHTVGFNAKLSVYSLGNVASGTPVLLHEYSAPCSEIGGQTRMALLQNTIYMVCAKKYLEPINTLAIMKDVTKPDSKFEPNTAFTTTIVDFDYFVAIGSSNTSTGGQPFGLIGKKAGYNLSKLQYSLPLAGQALGTIIGGVDAIIPEKFGIDPTTTTTRSAYPYPTSGGGGSGSDGGGNTVVVVAGKLPVKIIIIIVVAALFVGGGILAFCCGCIGGCCIVIKNAITGETPEIGVAKVQGLEVQEAKRDEAVGPSTDGLTYPVLGQQQPSTQDNGLAYLFIENQTAPEPSESAPAYSTPVMIYESPLTPPVTDPFTKYITALRYDPAGATDPSMSQGSGSWSTMSLNPTFGPSTFEKIWLFNSAAAAGGAETLNLAYLTRSDSGFQPTIVFGVFDFASATFNPTGRWDMTTLTYGSPMSILFRGSEMYYYATSSPSGNAKLTVYSLANVATNTPTALRTYNTTVCTDISGSISTALLQNSYYLTCSRSFNTNFTSLAILKDINSASATFAPAISIASTFNKLDFIVALGNSNNLNSNSTSTPVNGALPVLLMQKYESSVKSNLLFSMALSGPTFAVIEGGVDASIPEKFGIDPSKTTTGSYPNPTSGGGSGGGGSGGGGSTVVVVPGKLSVKIIIVIVVAALLVVGGLLAFFCGCLGGCCLGLKRAITGNKPEDKPAVVEVQPDWAQGQKAEEATVATTGAQTYPVLNEHHQSYAYNAPLPLPPAQNK